MIVTGNGRVSADIELSKSKGGNEYVSFDLAHDRGYGDKKTTDWYKCVAYGEVAQRMVNAKIKKGASIFITASLALEQYEKDGVKKTVHKLSVLEWSYNSSGKPKETKETDYTEMASKEASDMGVLSADDELPCE